MLGQCPIKTFRFHKSIQKWCSNCDYLSTFFEATNHVVMIHTVCLACGTHGLVVGAVCKFVCMLVSGRHCDMLRRDAVTKWIITAFGATTNWPSARFGLLACWCYFLVLGEYLQAVGMSRNLRDQTRMPWSWIQNMEEGNRKKERFTLSFQMRRQKGSRIVEMRHSDRRVNIKGKFLLRLV